MRAYLIWTFPASERRVSFSTNVQSPCLPLLQDSGNDDKERTYFTLPMQPQGTTIMIMSDALCGASISYSPLSFITSRTLTTAPPFRTSPEEMAAVWAGRRERDDEYRRVWWQSATLLATNLIYTPKKIEQNRKKQHKKTAIAPVDLGQKTEIYLSCPS